MSHTSFPQIVLRWAVQRGTSVLPKSTKPHRIASNADLFGWALEPADFQALNRFEVQLRMVDGKMFLHPRGPYKCVVIVVCYLGRGLHVCRLLLVAGIRSDIVCNNAKGCLGFTGYWPWYTLRLHACHDNRCAHRAPTLTLPGRHFCVFRKLSDLWDDPEDDVRIQKAMIKLYDMKTAEQVPCAQLATGASIPLLGLGELQPPNPYNHQTVMKWLRIACSASTPAALIEDTHRGLRLRVLGQPRTLCKGRLNPTTCIPHRPLQAPGSRSPARCMMRWCWRCRPGTATSTAPRCTPTSTRLGRRWSRWDGCVMPEL